MRIATSRGFGPLMSIDPDGTSFVEKKRAFLEGTVEAGADVLMKMDFAKLPELASRINPVLERVRNITKVAEDEDSQIDALLELRQATMELSREEAVQLSQQIQLMGTGGGGPSPRRRREDNCRAEGA